MILGPTTVGAKICPFRQNNAGTALGCPQMNKQTQLYKFSSDLSLLETQLSAE